MSVGLLASATVFALEMRSPVLAVALRALWGYMGHIGRGARENWQKLRGLLQGGAGKIRIRLERAVRNFREATQ